MQFLCGLKTVALEVPGGSGSVQFYSYSVIVARYISKHAYFAPLRQRQQTPASCPQSSRFLNLKNSTKANSSQFELFNVEDGSTHDNEACSITVATRARRSQRDWRCENQRTRSPSKANSAIRPRTTPTRKKAIATKAKATNPGSDASADPLLRTEALLKRAEERAERAKKRVEALEEFIRNELFPRIEPGPGPRHQRGQCRNS
ncbi:hypothetical protein S40285_10731 [Stachybotrys chlorohalonatus IBT 40285]|uniref:Uncharacterized protein n=1 Tax=Stachybotrys chlorohalonatus (strain IBT 40285) TaxID=1283841 RepID=A0A084R261_STAC4|nr:hypothetical protein S40285_10731 [Stachybotrys chlorohalonata IBT 40285]